LEGFRRVAVIDGVGVGEPLGHVDPGTGLDARLGVRVDRLGLLRHRLVDELVHLA
jgi:hypothetical protein